MNSVVTAFVGPLTLHAAGSCYTPSVCQTRQPRGSTLAHNRRTKCTCVTTPIAQGPAPAPAPAWHKRLKTGALVEYFANGALNIALLVSNDEKTIEVMNPKTSKTVKVAHGEVVSVWSHQLTEDELLQAISEAEELLSAVDIDISKLYSERSRGNRAFFNSTSAGRFLFPAVRSEYVASIAAGRVIMAHKSRFRRAGAGQGWRANPPAVAATREAAEFVKAAKRKLEGVNLEDCGLRCVEARAFLTALEVSAASSTKPNKALARVMKELEYEGTAVDAGKLLRDLGLWQEGGEESPQWTFSAEILETARQVRDMAKKRRMQWLRGEVPDGVERRSLIDMSSTVYCIDNRNTNFFDDALSVEVIEGGQIARICVHIADVAGLIELDSLLDKVARDRAQSMYLPLRPLHMLPPPVMEGASFSEKFPTEAITVRMDYNVYQKRIILCEIFTSVIPPVTRVSFDQFDAVLATNDKWLPNELSEERCRDLRMFANLSPSVAKFLQRPSKAPRDESEVSGVRLVRRSERGRTYRQAQVSTYQNSGAHTVVNDLLGVAGAILRQQARGLGIALPEEPGGGRYARRCGTAPMRRYVDLATQRQIRAGLLGLPLATKEEMDALRVWLTKRRTETEKTVMKKRTAALFENLAETVVRQKAVTGHEYAFVTGTVGTVNVSKRGVKRVSVRINGIGIDTAAGVDEKYEKEISEWVENANVVDGKDSNPMAKVPLASIALRKTFAVGTQVKLRIDSVDCLAQKIDAIVVDVLKGDTDGEEQ